MSPAPPEMLQVKFTEDPTEPRTGLPTYFWPFLLLLGLHIAAFCSQQLNEYSINRYSIGAILDLLAFVYFDQVGSDQLDIYNSG